jgi:hypothetical protein
MVNREVRSGQMIDGFQARELEIIAEVEPGTAKKFGLRCGATEFAITSTDEFHVGAVQTPSIRGRGEKPHRLWIVVSGGMVRVQVNNRAQYEKPLSLKEPCAVELFADGGAALFRKVEAWELRGEK